VISPRWPLGRALTVVVDPGAARQAAKEIVDQPQFQRPGPSAIERVQRWILDRLGRLLSYLGGSTAGAFVGWALLLGAVAAVVFLLVRLARSPRRIRPPSAEVVAEIEVGGRLDAAAWRRLADEHRAAGRWAEALRCRYRATVAELAERQLIAESDATTTGETRAAVAARSPQAAPAMAEATDRFDAVWYGGEIADQGAADQVAASSERVLEQIDGERS
jgi:hypothetical protein